jgi:hypothetical protein
MRSFNYAPVNAVVIFGLGIAVGAGFLGGFTRPTQVLTDLGTTATLHRACTSDDAVADFVCRNTWLANTRHSNR